MRRHFKINQKILLVALVSLSVLVLTISVSQTGHLRFPPLSYKKFVRNGGTVWTADRHVFLGTLPSNATEVARKPHGETSEIPFTEDLSSVEPKSVVAVKTSSLAKYEAHLKDTINSIRIKHKLRLKPSNLAHSQGRLQSGKAAILAQRLSNHSVLDSAQRLDARSQLVAKASARLTSLTNLKNWDARTTTLAGLNSSQWLVYWRSRKLPVNLLQRGSTAQDLLAVKPRAFLESYKNPCWRDGVVGMLHCQPYFYLVGAPKSGTTDLYARLAAHPEYARSAAKEPHWLTRSRFYRTSRGTFMYYILKVYGEATKKIQASVDPDNYHRKITGDCSASTLFDNDYWPLLPENRGRTEPLHTNSDFIHHLNPNTKIIAILRNPVERLYSDFLYFERSAAKKTKAAFHQAVVKAVTRMKQCLETRSNRSCAYDVTLEPIDPSLRLRIGMYHVYVEDYLRVFPRDQIHIIRLEDHSKDPMASMDRIFKFLGMASLPEPDMAVIGDANKRANSRRRYDVKRGDMLEATRDVLHEFYTPHNKRLAELLNDERFDYGRG